MKRILFVNLILFLFLIIKSQNLVTGKIVNQEGLPISNVIIQVKNTEYKSFSDENGDYTIKVPKGNKTIIFQKEGFNVQEVEITSESINVVMTSSIEIFELTLEQLMNLQVYFASKQFEEIEQVPVPITIITQEMIENSGAICLRDIIIQYVPGFTNVQDHNEVNFSNRGVYASSQQKVLILLNGHRLNSRAYSMANPDFSISLDKIKQIEILRGPASSLYGNVALTAVINIVTKTGQDINGGDIKYLQGNYGQFGATINYGNSEGNSDFFVWSTYYKSDGQKIKIEQSQDYSQFPHEGYAIVNGFKDRPAFDLGFTLKNKEFSTLFNISNCKMISPFTDGGTTGEVYNYDIYRSFAGQKSGLGNLAAHYTVQKSIVFPKQYKMNVSLYADFNELLTHLNTVPKDTMFAILEWKEYDLGADISLSKEFDFRRLGKANILVGIQNDFVDLFDSYMISGKGGELTSLVDKKNKHILEPGTENIHSAYIQYKHNYNDFLIFNIGTRFDYKNRHKGDAIYDISPRMSVIVIPSNKIDVKVSYSQSFVDAPYWYRYNSLASYLGSENLRPEHLRSFQLTPNFKLLNNKMILQLNLFYNYLYDFIFRDPNATGEMPRYINAGSLDLLGAELSLLFSQKLFTINANATYFYPYKAKNYAFSNNKIWNVPDYITNLTIDIYPFAFLGKRNFVFQLHSQYIGEQLSPIKSTFLNNQPYENLDYKVPSIFLLNGAVTLKNIYGFTLKMQMTNITDAKYYQGGSTRFPYPQPGRWFSVELNYHFK